MQMIGLVALLVPDYETGIAFFVDTLGFDLAEDAPQPDGKRWVVVRPPGSAGTGLLLAQAADERQRACVGEQGGGRVMLFLQTDDFWRDHAAYVARGVVFHETPREEPYGIVAVFEDCCGNRWDLIQPCGPV